MPLIVARLVLPEMNILPTVCKACIQKNSIHPFVEQWFKTLVSIIIMVWPMSGNSQLEACILIDDGQ